MRLLELYCVIVIKHVAFFTILCEITGNNGIHNSFLDVLVVSDLKKNIGGSTDLAEKRLEKGAFAYPYSPPLEPSHLIIVAVVREQICE